VISGDSRQCASRLFSVNKTRLVSEFDPPRSKNGKSHIIEGAHLIVFCLWTTRPCPSPHHEPFWPGEQRPRNALCAMIASMDGSATRSARHSSPRSCRLSGRHRPLLPTPCSSLLYPAVADNPFALLPRHIHGRRIVNAARRKFLAGAAKTDRG